MYLECVVYLLKVFRERGLSLGQLHTAFPALIVFRLRYVLPSWSGFLSREQIELTVTVTVTRTFLMRRLQ